MGAGSKRIREIRSHVAKTPYAIEEAVGCMLKEPAAKFDVSVDLNITLNIDPKKSDQQFRASVVLPHGSGKSVRVVVVSRDSLKLDEGSKAGAFRAGGLDLIDEIVSGWVEFDVMIATPDVMRDLAKCAKILGPRGLMPTPKAGTVTLDVAQAVIDATRGKVDLKPDKFGQIHLRVGKRSFDLSKLKENIIAVLLGVLQNRPKALKGIFVKSVYLSTTQGGGYRLSMERLGVESGEVGR